MTLPTERHGADWRPTPEEMERFALAMMAISLAVTNTMQTPPEVFRDVEKFLTMTENAHASGRSFSTLSTPIVNDLNEAFRRVFKPFVAFVEAVHANAPTANALTHTPEFEGWWERRMRGEM